MKEAVSDTGRVHLVDDRYEAPAPGRRFGAVTACGKTLRVYLVEGPGHMAISCKRCARMEATS